MRKILSASLASLALMACLDPGQDDTASSAFSAISPAKDSVGVSADTTLRLRWSHGDEGAVYDVYFGTETTPSIKVASDLIVDHLDIPRPLYERKYYWQVVAKNNGRVLIGPVWNFETIRHPMRGSWAIFRTGGDAEIEEFRFDIANVDQFGDANRVSFGLSGTFYGFSSPVPVAPQDSARYFVANDSIRLYLPVVYVFEGKKVSTQSGDVIKGTVQCVSPSSRSCGSFVMVKLESP